MLPGSGRWSGSNFNPRPTRGRFLGLSLWHLFGGHFNPRPTRGRFVVTVSMSSPGWYFNPRPTRRRFRKIALCRRPSLSIFSQMAKAQRNFSFFCNSICKKGAAAASAQVRPPLENAVRLAFAPLEYQRFCHVKARFGTDVLHLVLIAVPQIVKAQAVPLRVDDLF